MAKVVVEAFENSGLLCEDGLIEERIKLVHPEELSEICEKLKDDTLYSKLHVDKTKFTHAASAALSGGDYPCSALDCRMENVGRLIQFAALYSDTVYVRNPFDKYRGLEDIPNLDITSVQEKLAPDLLILHKLRSLIDRGVIQFVSFGDLCPCCMSMNSTRQSLKSKFEQHEESFRTLVRDSVKYVLMKRDDEFVIVCSGPSDLLAHGEGLIGIQFTRGIPDFLETHVREVAKDGSSVLTQEVVDSLGVAENITGRIIDSVSFELGSAHNLKSAYLLDNELEMSLVQNLIDDPVAKKHSKAMARHISCLLPYIECASIDSILSLRENEAESFLLFRNALRLAIAEYDSSRYEITERDAQLIFQDIIKPKVDALDSKISSSKSALKKYGYRKVSGVAFVCAVGAAAGIFSNSLLLGSFAATAAKFAVDTITESLDKSDAESVISGDDYYFLWKVKQLSS